MTRHCLAVAVVVFLGVSSASAQSSVLAIDAASADIYKSPTVASPVLGQAARGRELEVTRELGDWVRVSWAGAPDGIGFVRTSLERSGSRLLEARRRAG